jgi:hypothetical protein
MVSEGRRDLVIAELLFGAQIEKSGMFSNESRAKIGFSPALK